MRLALVLPFCLVWLTSCVVLPEGYNPDATERPTGIAVNYFTATPSDTPTASLTPSLTSPAVPTDTPTATGTATPLPTAVPSATRTRTPRPPALDLLIAGCTTGFDIFHGLGEVTNVYVTVQNVGGADLNDLQVTASATDEGQPHPDKTKRFQHLPSGYEVNFILTVDTTYEQGTTVQVDAVTKEAINESVATGNCQTLEAGFLSAFEARINAGVRPIAR